ncbi:MAG: histidine kinase [Lachnospiraceae bacterium]|nr:histidine kinase [Lachnospiraceae bacterium]
MMVILLVNIFLFANVNDIVKRLDDIYVSNVNLNDLSDALGSVQTSMTQYLNTKTSDAMESYYKDTKTFGTLLEMLNDRPTSNEPKLMEKNIRRMSYSYLRLTNQAIEAKRGRNVEKYNRYYEDATELYHYIASYIYSLNNKQFKTNSDSYEVLSFSLRYLEIVSSAVLVLVALGNTFLIILVTRNITNPLKALVEVANEVGEGNFNIELPDVSTNDEVGVVSKAFNKMVISMRSYIDRIKQNMKTERALKEKELMMENHLKDAQLKYLQAQISPHFLFNTLNAGAQLAMMEEADRTYEYIQKAAELFRYNMKKNNEIVTLREEMELVDNYIYILNVRFSGEIHYEKSVESGVADKLDRIMLPGMILQPIVENSVNHGIRDISWKGLITLHVYEKEEHICIEMKDNGIGIRPEILNKIMTGTLKEEDLSKASNGIGLDNVTSRLRLFCDREDVFEIFSEGEGKGTTVRIYLPGYGRCD